MAQMALRTMLAFIICSYLSMQHAQFGSGHGLIWLVTYPEIVGKNRRLRLGERRARYQEWGVMQCEGSFTESARLIFALAKVSCGHHYTGGMTAWPADIWHMHHKLGEPTDSFEVRIADLFLLSAPLVSHDALDSKGLPSVNPRLKQPIYWPCLGGTPEAWRNIKGSWGDEECTAGAVASAWGWSAQNALSPPFMGICVDAGTCFSIRHRHSQSLLCLVRWMSMSQERFIREFGFPDADWAKSRHREVEASDSFDQLTASALSHFLQRAREMWLEAKKEFPQEARVCGAQLGKAKGWHETNSESSKLSRNFCQTLTPNFDAHEH